MQNIQYDYLDNRYQNLTILGNEEKKSTYLVRDAVTGQIAVKKYIQPESIALYMRMRTLPNPHLVKIYHAVKKEDAALVIMEYVSGKTIEEWQKEISVFSEKQTLEYMEQLLDGILEIHKCGIVHRDINPANILISTDGVIKILDFDIGRQYKEVSSTDTTILGTVGYAAPEQFGFTQSDKRTDIYAIGVLMNVMLTGRLPKEQMYTNGRWEYIIKNCIHIDPEKRYQSAEEILWEIQVLKGEREPVSAESEPVQEKSIWPGFRTGKTWKKIIALLYYMMAVIYSVDSLVKCAKTKIPVAVLAEIVAVAIFLWFSALIPLNFLHWMDKVPIVRKFERFGRVVLGILLWVLLFYFGGLLDDFIRIDWLHIAVRTTG